MHPNDPFAHRRLTSPLNRRRMLERSASGFGALALSCMLNESRAAEGSVDPLAPKPTHHPARAKACIMLFMCGGPSQIDLFDPKPTLTK